MKKITFIIALTIVSFTWTSCDKDKDEKPQTKTEMLIAQPWKMNGFSIDPPIVIQGEEGPIELSDIFEEDDCWHDNTLTFFASGNNKTYSENEGANKCAEEDPAISTGTWSFNSTETSITITPEDDDSSTASIEELTATTFKISQEMEIEELGWTGEAIFTFEK